MPCRRACAAAGINAKRARRNDFSAPYLGPTQAAAVAGFPPDIPTAVGILLLDGTVGTRIVAKYFDSGAFADLKAEVNAGDIAQIA